MQKLTSEEIEAKVQELKEKYKRTITPIVFYADTDGEDQVLGFLKEASREAKERIMDKALMQGFSAAKVLLPDLLIKEESDSRILSSDPENDEFYFGALAAINGMLKFAQNQYKKN